MKKIFLLLTSLLLLGTGMSWGDVTWDFTTNTFLKGGTWSASAGTTNTAYATDGTTTLTYVASGSGDTWSSKNTQLQTNGKTSYSNNKLSQAYFTLPTLSGKGKLTITFGSATKGMSLRNSTANSNNVVATFTGTASTAVSSDEITLDASTTYYLTMESGKSYITKIEWKESASGPTISKDLDKTADVTVGVGKVFSITSSDATSYEWYSKTSATATDSTNLNTNAASYTYTASDPGTIYLRCVAINASGRTNSTLCAVTASAPSLPIITATWTPVSDTYNYGASATLPTRGASATSGSPVLGTDYSIALSVSGTAGIVTLNDAKTAISSISTATAGTATVTAKVSIIGTSYTAGEDASYTVTVNKAASNLAVASTASVDKNKTVDVTYTTSSTGDVTVVIDPEDESIAKVALDKTSKKLTITGVAEGSATITLSQAADATYNEGSKEIVVTVTDPYADKTIVKYVGATGNTGTFEVGSSKSTLADINAKIKTNTTSVTGVKLESTLSNSCYVKVSVDGGFKAGDKVDIAGIVYNSSARWGRIAITDNVSGESITELYSTGDLINGRLVNDDPTTGTYTLTKACDALYLGRASKPSDVSTTAGSIWITTLKVTRPYQYTITKGAMTNGDVTVVESAAKDATVTVTPVPATNYEVDKVYYINAGEETQNVITPTEDVYSFTMPGNNVTVAATFKATVQKWTVTYYDGETVLGTEQVENTNAPTASEITTTKELMTFDGWYESEDLSGDAVTLSSLSITAAKSLYGKWTKLYASSVDFAQYITDNSLSSDAALTADAIKALFTDKNIAISQTTSGVTLDPSGTDNSYVYKGLKLKNQGTNLTFYAAAGQKVTFKMGYVTSSNVTVSTDVNVSYSGSDTKSQTLKGITSYGSGVDPNYVDYTFTTSAITKFTIATTSDKTAVIKSITIKSDYPKWYLTSNIGEDGAVAGSWSDDEMTDDGTKVTKTLKKGKQYQLKLKEETAASTYTWFGAENATNEYKTSDETWTMATPGNNIYLTAGANGTYTFTRSESGSTQYIKVTYPTAYTVSYASGNDAATGSTASNTNIAAGENQEISANGFSYANHTFAGWVADKDVTINDAVVTAGTLIAAGSTLQNINSNITLTAQWTYAGTTAYYLNFYSSTGTKIDDMSYNFTKASEEATASTVTLDLKGKENNSGYSYGYYFRIGKANENDFCLDNSVINASITDWTYYQYGQNYVNTNLNTLNAGTYTFTLKETNTASQILLSVAYPETAAVTFGASENGSVSAVAGAWTLTSGDAVAKGQDVVFTATPSDGYSVEGWYSDAEMTTKIDGAGTETTYTISSIAAASTVYVKFAAPCATPTIACVNNQVKITTTTEDATIYYTTDDTDPTTESSVYSTGIAITASTTIKAIAAKSGMITSPVASMTVNKHILTEVKYTNGFNAFIQKDADNGNNGEVYAYYLNSESAPSISSVSLDETATTEYSLSDDVLSVTASDGAVLKFGVNVNSVAPYTGAGKTFDGTEDWIKSGGKYLTNPTESGTERTYYAYVINRLLKSNVTYTTDNRVRAGKTRIYFFVDKATSITLINDRGESLDTKRAIKVYVNGNEYTSVTEMPAYNATTPASITINTGKAAMIEISSNQDAGNTGWGKITLEGRHAGDNDEVYVDESLSLAAYDGNNVYWATYSNADYVTFWPSANATVKKASVSGSTMSLPELTKETVKIDGSNVEGYFVPANEGILIKSLTELGTSVPYYTVVNKTVDNFTDNMLYPGKGEVVSTPANCKYYMLAYKANTTGDERYQSLGFYWGATDGAAFKSRKGAAYLAVPQAQAAALRGFSFYDAVEPAVEPTTPDQPEVTALDEAKAQSANGIFLLNGKVYIRHNGKLYTPAGQLLK